MLSPTSKLNVRTGDVTVGEVEPIADYFRIFVKAGDQLRALLIRCFREMVNECTGFKWSGYDDLLARLKIYAGSQTDSRHFLEFTVKFRRGHWLLPVECIRIYLAPD